MTTTMRHRVVCVLFVLASGTVYFLGYAPTGTRWASDIALHLLLSVLMLGAWMTGGRATSNDHRWTLVSGVVARLVVVPVAVSFNHDVQRYMWDGAVFWAGLDPYRLAPDSSQVAALRAIWPTPLEHTGAATIYPPGAIFLFGLTASVGPMWAPWMWKLLIAGASFGTLFAGARLLDERRASRHLPLLAFSPLLLMGTATGATLDVVCALAVALGLLLVHRKRLGAAGTALGLGTLLKFLPVLAVLPIAIHLGWRGGRRLVASTAVVVGGGYAAAVLLGLAPLGILPVFFKKWRFGSPVFAALAWALGDIRALHVTPFLLALGLFVIAGLARRRSWTMSVPLALAVPLIVSPVVFPWYFAPIIPAMALAPSAFLLAWVTAVPLTNEVLDRFDATGLWRPAAWPLWTIGIAWGIGIALDTSRHRRARGLRDRHHVSTASAWGTSAIAPVLDQGTSRALASLHGNPR